VSAWQRFLDVLFPFGRNFKTGPQTRAERRESLSPAQHKALARRRARNKVARRSRRVNRVRSGK